MGPFKKSRRMKVLLWYLARCRRCYGEVFLSAWAEARKDYLADRVIYIKNAVGAPYMTRGELDAMHRQAARCNGGLSWLDHVCRFLYRWLRWASPRERSWVANEIAGRKICAQVNAMIPLGR